MSDSEVMILARCGVVFGIAVLVLTVITAVTQ